jgi:hypothetical protein
MTDATPGCPGNPCRCSPGLSGPAATADRASCGCGPACACSPACGCGPACACGPACGCARALAEGDDGTTRAGVPHGGAPAPHA